MAKKQQDVFGVIVNGDITGLNKAMQQATKIFKSTERSIQNVNKALALDPNDDALIEKKADLYRKAFQEAEKSARKLKSYMKQIESNEDFSYDKSLQEKFTNLQAEYKKMIAEAKKYKELLAGFEFKIKVDNFVKNMKECDDAIGRAKKSLENINNNIKLDPNNIELYRQKQELLNDAIRMTEVKIANYKKQLEEIKSDPNFIKGLDDLDNTFTKLSTDIAENEKQLAIWKKQASVSAEMDRFGTQIRTLGKAFNDISANTRQLSRAFQVVASTGFEAFKQTETDIANIKRVVKDLSESTISDLNDMAVATGTAFTNIAEYATIAGALGIAEQDISKFAKTMVDLNTATGGVFSGEEGAKGIAVFLKQLGLGIEQAENFGSAIAVIGDKYADIGDETVRVATRLTGLNSIINTNQYQLIGLAGVMSDLGLSADTNANAINRAFLQIDKVLGGGVKDAESKLESLAKTSGMTSNEFRKAWGENAVDAFLKFTDGLKSSVFNEINTAIASSSDEVMKFADVLGMSAEQFTRAWSEDSQGMFNKYVEALGELGDEGVVASAVLAELGISSVNTAQTMLRLAGSGNEVRKAIQLTAQAWGENTALAEKSGIVYETTERKLQGLYEAIRQLLGSMIDTFSPTIKNMADSTTKFIKQLNSANPVVKQLATVFLTFGAAVSPVTRVLGGFVDFFASPNLITGMTQFQTVLGGINTLITSPLGVVAGIGLFVAALANLEKQAYESSGFVKLNNELTEMSDKFNGISSTANDIYLQAISSIDEKTIGYANTIDKLNEKLSTEKLSYQERSALINEINGYISSLNATLGEEIFYFDTTSGKILSQKGDIETVKEAYLEYVGEIKKQHWLEAHAEEYESAKKGLKDVESDIIAANETFFATTQGIPDNVVEMFLAARSVNDTVEGAIQEAQNSLNKEGITYQTEWFDTLRDAYNNYIVTYGQAEQNAQLFKNAIETYKTVEGATVEEFDAIVADIEKASDQAVENYTTLNTVTYPELEKHRDLLLTATKEEDSINKDIVDKLEDEIIKLKYQQEQVKAQFSNWEKIKNKQNEIIQDWENYNPSTKTATFYINQIYTTSGSPVGGTGGFGGSGGFGLSSGGLYGNIFDALKNTMARNQLMSGGFNSGGLVLNANFVIHNASNLNTKQLASEMANQMLDIIDVQLGKRW